MAKRKRQRFKATNQEHVMREVRKWMADHPRADGKVDVDAMTQSFIDNNVFEDQRPSRFRVTRQMVAHAMARDHIHDDEFGEVRTMHAVRKEVDGQIVWEWAAGKKAKPDHVSMSLAQRRNSAEARVQQMEADRLWYNKHNIYGAEIARPSYDFNASLEEKLLADSHGGEYPDSKPTD